MLAEPGHYDYAPYSGRPRIVWPGGARIAVWLAPNIEHYELEPPDNPRKAPWPRPVPDVLNYSHRDYGNRVGFWRMADVMARHGVRGSVSLNVAVCDHYPGDHRALLRARLGAVQPRHLQHALLLRPVGGPAARA